MVHRIVIVVMVFLSIPNLLNSQSHLITVLVKVEQSNGAWRRYWYEDKRKEVFERNRNIPKDQMFPEYEVQSEPSKHLFGYTKKQERSIEDYVSNVRIPELVIRKYDKSGDLEREEWDWDTDDNKNMDRYFLYHYDERNKLLIKQSYASTEEDPYETLTREYGENGKLIKEQRINQMETRSFYYNGKEQLIKEDWDIRGDYGFTVYQYKSDLLTSKEKHWNGKVYIHSYSYDEKGRMIEYMDDGKKFTYQYNIDGELSQFARKYSSGSPEITFYYYDKGLLSKFEEKDGEGEDVYLVMRYFYDKDGNLEREEWTSSRSESKGWCLYTYETIQLE